MERMPEWMVALFAAVYAAAGSGLMAAGALVRCEAPRGEGVPSGGFCTDLVEGGHWPVLVLIPMILSVVVVRTFTPEGPSRRWAWLVLALLDVVLVCVGIEGSAAPAEVGG